MSFVYPVDGTDTFSINAVYDLNNIEFGDVTAADISFGGAPIGTTFTVSGTGGQMQVLDDDNLLEDNNDLASALNEQIPENQTLDYTLQTLTEDFGGSSAGDYVWSRAYQEFQVYDPEGNLVLDDNGDPVVGRFYQIRTGDWNGEGPVVEYPHASDPNDGPYGNLSGPWEEYYAFSGDVPIGPDYTYEIISEQSGQGNQTWSEFEAVTVVPCFTRGMKIETSRGEVKVEDLEVGDEVRTLDHGFQPIRFIHSRKVKADPKNYPVFFARGSIYNTEDIIVSPKHRFLTKYLPSNVIPRFVDSANDDHLIHADLLVNNRDIRFIKDIPFVEYFHFMFDQHELVFCNGTISESWHPLRRNLKRDDATRDELLRLFPEIRHKIKTNTPQVREDACSYMIVIDDKNRHALRRTRQAL